jgi:phosphoribosylglycinamide formyltransferase-1
MNKQRIAIFASGTGSNAVRLINHFEEHPTIEVAFVLSNKKDAKVLSSSAELGVTAWYHSNDAISNGDFLAGLMEENKIDWIILAGYLRLIPSKLIEAYEGRIINLHPSLLPKFGGKGMYGRNVHEAVLANEEKESGISVHFVNERFDEGAMIAQFFCQVQSTDKIEDLEGKIRLIEHTYFPIVVEHTILNTHS